MTNQIGKRYTCTKLAPRYYVLSLVRVLLFVVGRKWKSRNPDPSRPQTRTVNQALK